MCKRYSSDVPNVQKAREVKIKLYEKLVCHPELAITYSLMSIVHVMFVRGVMPKLPRRTLMYLRYTSKQKTIFHTSNSTKTCQT